MRIFPRGRTGSTLVLNLLIMTVFAMTSVIVYAAAKSQVKAVVYDARVLQAQAIAEAGLEDALHKLYLSPYGRTGFTQKAFAGGYYTVTMTNAVSPVVTATGYSSSLLLVGRSVKTISATAVIVSSGTPIDAVLASEDLTVNGTIDAYDPTESLTPTTFMSGATIWSNEGIKTPNSCGSDLIFGNAVYHQGDTAPANSCVSGTITSTTTNKAIPMSTCGTCKTVNNNLAGIAPAGAYSNSSKKLTINGTVTLSSGTYYFKDIEFKNSGILSVNTTTGPVKIFYDNSLKENGTCAINNISKIPSRLLISDMISGSHTVDLSCPGMTHAYLEGSTAHFKLHSPAELYGHIFADTITIDAGAELHYDLGAGVTVLSVDMVTGTAGSWSESYKRQ